MSMSGRYPAYLDRRQSRSRADDRRLERMARRSAGRRFLIDSLCERDRLRAGWFRLPRESRGARLWRSLFGAAGNRVKLFDYISAGGARWIAGRPGTVPYARGRRRLYTAAVCMMVAWWIFRWIPPP